MALHDPVITLQSVTPTLPDRFDITLRLVIPDSDATATGIDQTFTIAHKQGVSLSTHNVTFRDMMNAKIAEYKRSETIRNNAGWSTAITAIRGGLVL